jgi:hypothetical protein
MSFETLLLAHESTIRFGVFLGTFVLMALWELVAPLRVAATSKAIRWPNHLLLAAVNIFLVRILFPLAAVALAVLRQRARHRTVRRVDGPIRRVIRRFAAGP